MGRATRARHLGKACADKRRMQVRNRKIPGIFAEVFQQGRLEIAFNFRLGRIDDLQDIGRAVGDRDLEIQVPLAVEWSKCSFQAEVLREERARLLGGKFRFCLQHVIHGALTVAARVAWPTT
jgi:hypothetical protein